MKEQQVNDALLRQFLLGEVDEETRQQIESRFITDDLFRESVLAIEDDLVEEYLEGGLAADSREKFMSRYADTAPQRQQLRIVKLIKEYAVANDVENPRDISTSFGSGFGLSRSRLKSIVLVPIAAIMIIGFSVAVIWLSNRRERSRNHLAAEQQLARLNTSLTSGEAPHTLSSVLAPVSVRAVGPQTELTPRTDTQIVELRLLWIQKEHYGTYQAVFHRVGNAEEFNVSNLQPDNDGKMIRLRIPIELLARGLYQISLRGFSDDGTRSPAEEYTFSINRPS